MLCSIRLRRFWRATVLLRFDNAAEVLPKSWPTATASDWEKALANPRNLFRLSDCTKVLKKGSNSSVVSRHLELGQAKLEVFCKLSHRRNLVRKALGLFRRSRPSHHWKIAWDLLEYGIPTALPIAVFEQRLGPIRLAAGIITLSLLPGESLEHFAHGQAASWTEASRRRLTADLALLIRKLHDHNFFHRDLKGQNIFIHHHKSSDVHIYLLDLDSCRPNGQSYSKRVKSLARLGRASLNWPAVGRTSRLRFLKTYLRDGQRPDWPWKTWWRDIDRRITRKLCRRAAR